MSGAVTQKAWGLPGKRPVARTAAPKSGGPSVSPASAALGRKRLVLLLAALMFGFGLVMITSAASGTSLLQDGDQWIFLKRQLIVGAGGLIGLLLAMRLPLKAVRRLTKPLLVVSVVMLFVVFIPGVGHSANGATRWIALPGGFTLQPSEFVKLALVLYLADHLARVPPPIHWMRDFIRSPGGVGLLLVGVIFIQRDLGSAMVTGGMIVALYVLAGTSWRLIGSVVGPGTALIVLGIVSEEFRRERFMAFLNPWADPQGPGYQLVQALIAIGSGGVFGLGLGHSVQKIHFLPEAHTDMIFAIVVEELGLVGVIAVLGGFCALAVVGTRIALRAGSRYEALLAAGLTATLCGQAALNVAGVVGALPLTGVPLPLVSYGGSNLLISLTALGLLANLAVAQHESPRPRAGGQAAAPGRRSRWRNRRASGSGVGSG